MKLYYCQQTVATRRCDGGGDSYYPSSSIESSKPVDVSSDAHSGPSGSEAGSSDVHSSPSGSEAGSSDVLSGSSELSSSASIWSSASSIGLSSESGSGSLIGSLSSGGSGVVYTSNWEPM